MVFCRDFKELLNKVKKLEKDDVMPMLMWMYKES